MPAARVVKTFDELEDSESGFAWILKVTTHKQLAFECRIEALAHRVVVTIADGSHRRNHAGFLAALPECDRGVLGALIGVVDDADRVALMNGHVEGIKHELRLKMRFHRPTNNPTAEDVEHDSDEQEARRVGT